MDGPSPNSPEGILVGQTPTLARPQSVSTSQRRPYKRVPLAKHTALSHLQKGDMTSVDLSRLMGCTIEQARNYLTYLVKIGLAVRRPSIPAPLCPHCGCYRSGRMLRVYGVQAGGAR